MRAADLERALSAVPRHAGARAELEQYRTPDAIAARLLLAAHADGALAGRRVLDLGCGTGIFALGAAMLGAAEALGLDVDAGAIASAQESARRMGLEGKVRFEVADGRASPVPPADTVLMNPPFGAQAANRHADRVFLQRAWDATRPAGTVWFLAQVRTESFLQAFADELGAAIERVAVWDYPLEATMAHHAEEARLVKVGGYRLSAPGT